LEYFQGLKMIGSHNLSKHFKDDLKKFELIYNITPIIFVD
ncbi:transcriptional regulator, partial [Enterococcus faecium]|nr:transcriptional regulator [Enterococcus faecium]